MFTIGEKRYPIYRMAASWTQNNLDYRNATSIYRMFKKDPGIHAVNQKAFEWVDRILKVDKYKDKECEDIDIEVTFIGNETWCINWFNHYTYNSHLTDTELLESFENFVMSKLCLNETAKAEGKPEPYCLMGAEDRYRWQGPCRCEKCTERGIVYIDH